MVASIEELHGHVDARVALASDPQVMVGEHTEPVGQEGVVVHSFVTTSTTTKHQSVMFNNSQCSLFSQRQCGDGLGCHKLVLVSLVL